MSYAPSSLSSPSRPAWLPRVAAGERDAMDGCLVAYTGLVWSLARRFLRDDSDAQDAVQEIFLELWRSANRYDPTVASETTFVAMIARRRLMDWRRRQARRPVFEPLPESPEGTAYDPPAPSVEPSRLDDDAARALAVLDTLPAEQREILRLSLAEGWSHGDIAHQMGTPLGTVKSHLRRGLLRLRAALGMRETKELEERS